MGCIYLFNGIPDTGQMALNKNDQRLSREIPKSQQDFHLKIIQSREILFFNDKDVKMDLKDSTKSNTTDKNFKGQLISKRF